MATPFKILDSIFEVANTDNLTIHARNSSISCRDLKSVQFLPNFFAMVTPLILYGTFELAGPKNLTN